MLNQNLLFFSANNFMTYFPVLIIFVCYSMDIPAVILWHFVVRLEGKLKDKLP